MGWDNRLLVLCNRGWTGPALDGVMLALTVAAMPLVVLLPLGLLPTRHRRAGMGLWLVLVLALTTTLGCKFLLCRPRPEGVRLLTSMSTFPSFPSGHAASVWGYALFAALVWRKRGMWTWPAAFLISCSRVYLGQHYPSDVLGGAIIGVVAAVVVYGCFYRPQGRRPRWAWLMWGQFGAMTLITLAAYLDLLHVGFLARPGADKVLHFVLFGMLAFFAIGWWAARPAWWVLAVLGLGTVVEEGLQSLSAVRSFSLIDLSASLGGILLFGWLACLITRRTRQMGE